MNSVSIIFEQNVFSETIVQVQHSPYLTDLLLCNFLSFLKLKMDLMGKI